MEIYRYNIDEVYKAYPSYLRMVDCSADCYFRVSVLDSVSSEHETFCEMEVYPDSKSHECVVDLTSVIRSIGEARCFLEVYDSSTEVTHYYDCNIRGNEGVSIALCGQPKYFVGSEIMVTYGYQYVSIGQNTRVYLPPSYLLRFGRICPAMQCFYIREGGRQTIIVDSSFNPPYGIDLAIPPGSLKVLEEPYTLVSNFYRGQFMNIYTQDAGGGYVQLNKTLWVKPTMSHLRYALVKWINRFGYVNLFLWEVRNLKRVTEDNRDLDRLPQITYSVQKKYNLTGTLFLDELKAYDVWFYADIVTSPQVKVYFIASSDLMPVNSDMLPVKITTEEVTIPTTDANENFSIEVEFEYYNTNDYF